MHPLRTNDEVIFGKPSERVAGLTVMASRDVDGGAARLIHRRRGRRVSERPADLRDAESPRRLEPMIPRPQRGGRPRKTDMQAAVNPILYLLRTTAPGATCRVITFRYARRSTTSFASSTVMASGSYRCHAKDFENLAETLATLVTPCLHPACPQAAPQGVSQSARSWRAGPVAGEERPLWVR